MGNENKNMQPAGDRVNDAGRDMKRKGTANKKSQASVNQKRKVISIILIIMLIFGSGISFDATVLGNQQGQAENTPKTIYETLEIGSLLDLIEIKGNIKDGYYYDFVDGTEEKLDVLVERLQKEKNKAITKNLLKKMIKAEVVNQFPFLQGTNGSSYASGNSVAETVWNFFIGNGYSELAAAGAMGNIHQESGGFNPAIVENGGSGAGIGLCQWSYGRRDKLEAYAKAMGKEWQDLDIQLEFLLMELQGGSEYAGDGFNENQTLKSQWENAKTPEEATEAFEYGFERAGTPMMENRKFWANIYYERYRGTYQATLENESSSDNSYLGEFSGTVRIRRVTPNKNIAEMKNTGTGAVTDTTSNESNLAVNQQIEDEINANNTSGTWSVYAKNLTANSVKVTVNNQKLKSGNLISLFIMATAFEEIEKGDINKDEVINDIKSMIRSNDNDATDRMIEKLGYNKINNYIKTNSYNNTEIHKKINEESTNGDNYTSAMDVGNLLEKIQRGTCITKEASQEMTEILKTQMIKNGIPAGIPEEIETANKIGESDQTQSDAAIVYKEGTYYVLVVMSNDIADTTIAKSKIQNISAKIYDLISASDSSQEVTVTSSTTTTTSGVESKIYDLKYVEPKVFNEYVESNSRQALRVYTLDPDTKKLMVANWSYTTEEGLKIIASEPINFRSVLNKYTMPIEYMIDFLIHTDDAKMVGKLADLALNSEYIIAIQDNVTTVQTTVDNQEKNYRTIRMPDNTYKISRFEDWHITSKEVTVKETVSNEIELTYADSWFVKFSKTSSYATMAFNQTSGNNLTAEEGDFIGDFKTTVYCASCNSPVGSITTASGTSAMPNHTIAVHENYFNGEAGNGQLSKGSQVVINGEVYTVEDVGDQEGVLQDNWIAIFCEGPCQKHDGSLESGNGTVPVYEAKNVSGIQDNVEADNKSLKGLNTIVGVSGEVKDTTTVMEESLGVERVVGEMRSITDVTEKKKITTVRTISNKYDSGKENVESVEQKFIDVFLSSKGILNRFNMGWMETLLEKNERTVNMIDLTKYLYNKAKNYHANKQEGGYNFDVYKRNDLYNIYSSSGILEEFMKSLINNPLRLYMSNHASIDEGEIKNYITADVDEPSYKMLTNQYGGRGFGFDIFHRINETNWNTGKPLENRVVEHYEELGFDITPYVNMDQTIETNIVDQVMEKELEKWKNIIANSIKNKGIELENYQIDALTAVAYEYGWSEKDTDSFRTAYDTYYQGNNKVAFRNNFSIAQGTIRPFSMISDVAHKTEEEEKEQLKSQLIWNLFEKGEYKTPEGEILDVDSFKGKGEILGVAYEVWKKVCDNYTVYGAIGEVPPADSNIQIDCTGYVSWVLYEYGKATGDKYLEGEFNRHQHSTTELREKVEWNKTKSGFEVIQVAGGQDVREMLQPGDILARTAADESTGHAMIVVEVKDGTVYAYDCGSASNWLGKNGNPAINTSFAASDPRAGAIIRKK